MWHTQLWCSFLYLIFYSDVRHALDDEDDNELRPCVHGQRKDNRQATAMASLACSFLFTTIPLSAMPGTMHPVGNTCQAVMKRKLIHCLVVSNIVCILFSQHPRQKIVRLLTYQKFPPIFAILSLASERAVKINLLEAE